MCVVIVVCPICMLTLKAVYVCVWWLLFVLYIDCQNSVCMHVIIVCSIRWLSDQCLYVCGGHSNCHLSQTVCLRMVYIYACVDHCYFMFVPQKDSLDSVHAYDKYHWVIMWVWWPFFLDPHSNCLKDVYVCGYHSSSPPPPAVTFWTIYVFVWCRSSLSPHSDSLNSSWSGAHEGSEGSDDSSNGDHFFAVGKDLVSAMDSR